MTITRTDAELAITHDDGNVIRPIARRTRLDPRPEREAGRMSACQEIVYPRGTNDSRPCSRQAQPGGIYCAQHQAANERAERRAAADQAEREAARAAQEAVEMAVQVGREAVRAAQEAAERAAEVRRQKPTHRAARLALRGFAALIALAIVLNVAPMLWHGITEFRPQRLVTGLWPPRPTEEYLELVALWGASVYLIGPMVSDWRHRNDLPHSPDAQVATFPEEDDESVRGDSGH